MVPDFHRGKHDMVIPQPVYMNAEEMEKLRKIRETEPGGLGLQRSDSRNSHMSKPTTASSSIIEDFPDDDLKTPTVEELSFPGQKVIEDGSSSSSSGSSSGYGSQNAIK